MKNIHFFLPFLQIFFKFEICQIKGIFLKNSTTFHVTLGKSMNFPEFVFCSVKVGNNSIVSLRPQVRWYMRNIGHLSRVSINTCFLFQPVYLVL